MGEGTFGNPSPNIEMSLCLWKVVAASVRGTSHERTGQPCQDAHYRDILPEGVLVVAIADGAGSAALGDVGADIATRTAVESVSSQITTQQLSEYTENWQPFMINALKASRTALEIEAAKREVKLRDLATTLILVVAMPELIVVAQVGDGAAVAGDTAGNVILLSTPQSGEYINQTNFLTSNGILESAQITVCRGPIAHIAVFSDGLQMLALNMSEGTPHKPFFFPLFRFVAEVADETEAEEELKLFLRSKRVREQTDDDLTLLLASLTMQFPKRMIT